ncbi:hypothetical protein FA95DRAFT_1612095 [Auriscalpium vulgare]|uniref:Uncharacterized protein n=1 Tax=Auriscalpium vulgare TaxID=40419 RepID=A0ACB8R8X8_9AGAM|nr:hypothetical protein FA95DRAFT_1612095 [Auriscalpium vulgare]
MPLRMNALCATNALSTTNAFVDTHNAFRELNPLDSPSDSSTLRPLQGSKPLCTTACHSFAWGGTLVLRSERERESFNLCSLLADLESRLPPSTVSNTNPAGLVSDYQASNVNAFPAGLGGCSGQ